jgi:hypothetical protein
MRAILHPGRQRRASVLRALVLMVFLPIPLGSWAASSMLQGPYWSVGRVQLSYHNTGVLRASQSYFISTKSRLFLLEALDYNHNVRNGTFDSGRFQLFVGGPVSLGSDPQLFGWVSRLDHVEYGNAAGTPRGHRSDVRVGGQLTVHRIAPLADWFKRNQADLFVQVFPIRTNRDFGVVDTFTRFSKRFSPKFVVRGVLRTYHYPGAVVATFESDFIYEMSKQHDLLLRIGTSNRDYAGLANKDFQFGAGIRINF